ncbi:MAG TPA: M67 family metallopeptidase [Rhizomicrobium sp.]|nr:M67 family metallopeptidase [Rhizomicrobium sp.]
MSRLGLSAGLRDALAREARAAWPRECCGLIEGVREGEGWRALALHPTANIAGAPERFEIDPAAHVRLLRALRGTGRDVIGCYHSHPDGVAAPSARDGGVDFIWLIAAVDARDCRAMKAYLRGDGAWRALALDVSGPRREPAPCA